MFALLYIVFYPVYINTAIYFTCRKSSAGDNAPADIIVSLTSIPASKAIMAPSAPGTTPQKHGVKLFCLVGSENFFDFLMLFRPQLKHLLNIIPVQKKLPVILLVQVKNLENLFV